MSVAWAKVNQCEDRYVEGNRASWKALEDVTDELKEQNQMAWIQAMNNIYNRAEEIILWELIYEEDMVRNFTRNFGTKHRADGSSCKEYKKLLELI